MQMNLSKTEIQRTQIDLKIRKKARFKKLVIWLLVDLAVAAIIFALLLYRPGRYKPADLGSGSYKRGQVSPYLTHDLGPAQGIVGLQAFPEILFKKRNVYLHSGNHRRNDSHCLCAKIKNGIDRGSGIKLIVHLAMASYRRRQSGVNRVQPDNQGSFLGFHGVAETVSKMTCHILNPHNWKKLLINI